MFCFVQQEDRTKKGSRDLRIKDYLSKVCRSELVTHQPDVTLQQESKTKPPFLVAEPQQAAGASCLTGRALRLRHKRSSLL